MLITKLVKNTVISYLPHIFPNAHTCTACLATNMPHQNDIFLITDEHILTHYCHPKLIVYNRDHSLCCIVYGFRKCIMTSIYHCCIVENSFPILKCLCALLIHPSLPSFFKYIIFIIFFPLPFCPLISLPPSNHHTIVHVHESFFFFAQSFHTLTSPQLAVICSPSVSLSLFCLLV